MDINITGGNIFTVAGVMTNFSGMFELGASTGFLQFNPATNFGGSAAATFDLGTATATLNNLNGNLTLWLGALTGSTNTTLSGAAAQANPTVYVVGGNGASTEFDGSIVDGTGPTAIVKAGSGTLILTGTNSDYSGGTTISGGTVLVNNLGGGALGSGPVEVGSGATLGGNGIVDSAVTVDNGGILAPGGAGPGTLTLDGDFLFLGTNSVLQYQLGTNSDQIVVSGDLNLGGVLNITDAGGFGAGTYTLFTYAGSLFTNGSPGVLAMGAVPNTNLAYAIDISSNGLVNLIVSVPPTPFQQWQLNYFGCTNCPQADPNEDPLGKGISNTNQFLLGLNPTNAASVFRITSVLSQGGTHTVTWSTAGVRTNVVQGATGDGNGGYSNNFTDISGSIILNVSGDTSTNYADGSGTNNYYRIRLGP